MTKLKSLIIAIIFCQTLITRTNAEGVQYNYPLYPFSKDLSQTLTFKIMLRCALPDDISNLEMSLVANYIRQIDCITRGIPKVVILGGFQENGHDHTYPWWTPIDDSFSAPGRLKGKAALEWLINEAKKYNTTCTFHVNPFDAYMDSWKWDYYVDNDLLCRNADGSLVKGGVWWNRQSYLVNMVNEWNSGVTAERIDDFLSELPNVKETGVLYFDNQTQYPASPKHRVNQSDQITAIKRTAQYLKDEYNIQLIGEYADVNLYGFNSLGVTWDWFASLNINQMEVPAYIACGGRNLSHDNLLGGYNDINKRRLQVFGASLQLEDIQFQHDPSKVVREFTHHTLVYFYLNRLLRQSLTTEGQYGMNLFLSDNVESKWESDNIHRLYRDGKLMKEGYDVFMPVYWVNHLEIMAYSYNGRNSVWDFPREWNNVTSVDKYKFSSNFYGLELVEANIPVSNNQIDLMLEAGIAQIIVPSGTNINSGTIYENPPSGTVSFIGKDDLTQGNWKDSYGKLGYDIFGAGASLPDNVTINYVGDRLNILESTSSRAQALQKPDNTERIEAVRTSTLHQIIDVQIPEEKTISLYFADYKEKNCQVVIDVIDANTKQVLHSELLNSFQSGIYLKYKIGGHVQFRITRFFYDGYGNPDYPVCSALFIDEKTNSAIGNPDYDENKLICTPTLFSDELKIEATIRNSDNVLICIHSLDGKILYSKNVKVTGNKARLYTSKQELGISKGVYIVTARTNKEILNGKIICK